MRPIVRDDGRWDSLLVVVNRARYGRDGTFFPARLHDRGRLVPGQRADLVQWTIDHPAELAYWLGGDATHSVVIGGRRVAG